MRPRRASAATPLATVSAPRGKSPPCVYRGFCNFGCSTNAKQSALVVWVPRALRAGVDPDSIVKQLKGIRCPSPLLGRGGMTYSCADSIGKAIEKSSRKGGSEAVEEAPAETTLDAFATHTNGHGNVVGACPDCGGPLRHEAGCMVCKFCGYSKCG